MTKESIDSYENNDNDLIFGDRLVGWDLKFVHDHASTCSNNCNTHPSTKFRTVVKKCKYFARSQSPSPPFT